MVLSRALQAVKIPQGPQAALSQSFHPKESSDHWQPSVLNFESTFVPTIVAFLTIVLSWDARMAHQIVRSGCRSSNCDSHRLILILMRAVLAFVTTTLIMMPTGKRGITTEPACSSNLARSRPGTPCFTSDSLPGRAFTSS